GLFDLRDELACLGVLAVLAHEQLAATEDDGQVVVEVVRDAAGQPADGLQFARLRVADIHLGGPGTVVQGPFRVTHAEGPRSPAANAAALRDCATPLLRL